VDQLLEDREVRPQALGIKPGLSLYGHAAIVSTYRVYAAPSLQCWGHPRFRACRERLR
jgi:hypothetical protein